MKKKKIIILGGGITGLATRFFLSKYDPHLEVVLIEKQEVLGGVIGKKSKGDKHWDMGPKTFSLARTPTLNSLIDELGLASSRQFSDEAAKLRYLVKGNQLRALPNRLSDFVVKKAYRQWLPSLLTEWARPTNKEDESIWEFANRRFGSKIASDVFDPITLGVYGGDAKKLSVKACFAELKEKESSWGSLTKAMIFDKKKEKPKKGLFTLKGGMMELINTLEKQGKGLIIKGEGIKQVVQETGGWSLKGLQAYRADHIISALPLEMMTHLFSPIDASIAVFAEQTPLLDISFTTLFFRSDIFTKKGFGCIFPTSEKSDFLGVIFDSCLYRDPSGYFKCTLLMRKPLSKQVIYEKIQTLFQTKEKPVFEDSVVYHQALPQFLIGHVERVTGLEAHLKQYLPNLTLSGNYLQGVSVEACVKKAHQNALTLTQ